MKTLILIATLLVLVAAHVCHVVECHARDRVQNEILDELVRLSE